MKYERAENVLLTYPTANLMINSTDHTQLLNDHSETFLLGCRPLT